MLGCFFPSQAIWIKVKRVHCNNFFLFLVSHCPFVQFHLPVSQRFCVCPEEAKHPFLYSWHSCRPSLNQNRKMDKVLNSTVQISEVRPIMSALYYFYLNASLAYVSGRWADVLPPPTPPFFNFGYNEIMGVSSPPPPSQFNLIAWVWDGHTVPQVYIWDRGGKS